MACRLTGLRTTIVVADRRMTTTTAARSWRTGLSRGRRFLAAGQRFRLDRIPRCLLASTSTSAGRRGHRRTAASAWSRCVADPTTTSAVASRHTRPFRSCHQNCWIHRSSHQNYWSHRSTHRSYSIPRSRSSPMSDGRRNTGGRCTRTRLRNPCRRPSTLGRASADSDTSGAVGGTPRLQGPRRWATLLRASLKWSLKWSHLDPRAR